MSIDVSKLSTQGLLKLLVNGSILPETKTRGVFESLMVLWDNRTQRFRRVQRGWSLFEVTIPGTCLFDRFDAMPPKKVDRAGKPTRPMFVAVSVNLQGYYSPSSLRRLFGKGLKPIQRFNPKTKQHFTVGYSFNGEKVATGSNGRFELVLAGIGSEIRARLAAEALATAEKKCRSKFYVFPAHSRWVSKRSSTGFVVLVTRGMNLWKKVVAELDGEIPSEERLSELMLRAGKDAWPEFMSPVETKTLRVFREELSILGEDCFSDDGIAYVRKSNLLEDGSIALIKGRTRGLMRTGVLKGRLMSSNAQTTVGPNGSLIDPSVDGWCYSTFIKWNNLSFPEGEDYVDVTVEYAVTKYETFDRKDAYRINTYWNVLGDFPEPSRNYFRRVLQRDAVRKAAEIRNLPESLTQSILRRMDSVEGLVVGDGDLAKWLLGFYSLDRVTRSRDRLAKSFMSARVGGTLYPAVIYTTSVMIGGRVYRIRPDEYVASPLVRDAVLSGRKSLNGDRVTDTVARYPLIGPGSMLGLRMAEGVADDTSGYVVFCNPLAGTAQQGDCDDFVMVVPGIVSNIRPSTYVPFITKHVSATQVGTCLGAYFHGKYSQDKVAIFVAAYVACIADIHAYSHGRTERYVQMLEPLAQAIQDAVQGIKKYNDTTLGITGVYKLVAKVRSELGLSPSSRSAAAVMVNPKVNDLGVVADVYQVDVQPSSLLGNHKLRDYNLELTNTERTLMNKAWKLGYMAFDYEFVSLLMEEVVGVTRQQVYDDPSIIDGLDSSRLVRAIQLYTYMAYTLARLMPKYAKAKFIQMSGLTLWIGSQLVERTDV